MQKFTLLFLLLAGLRPATKAQCDAAFTLSVDHNDVSVQALTTAPNVVHSWHFGDYTFGNGASASHSYTYPGTYFVVHIVTDSFSTCLDSSIQQVVIDVPAGCNNGFTMTRDNLQSYHYVFDPLPALPGVSVQQYDWTINGQPVSALSSFDRSFLPGVYSICLQTATSTGCRASSCQTLTVAIMDTCAWHASFTANSVSDNPKEISFMPQPSGDEVHYLWTFDAANPWTTSLDSSPVHIYDHPGDYTVTLQVGDTLRGCYDSVRQVVHVPGVASDSCIVSFGWMVLHSNSGAQIVLSPVSNQSILSQTWSVFNVRTPQDMYTSDQTYPVYSAADTGYFIVCISITTTAGCTRQFCNGIFLAPDSLADSTAGKVLSYPNPTTDEVRLRLQLERPESIHLTVYSVEGLPVLSLAHSGSSGMNELMLPVRQLRAGQYFVDIQYGNMRKRSIFLKL